MLVKFITPKSVYFYSVMDEGKYQDMLRNIKGTKERGDSFIQLERRYTKKADYTDLNEEVWLNVNSVQSIEIDRSEEFNVVEDKNPDQSHLLAAKTFSNLTPEELRVAQLIKQPSIPLQEAANAREIALRVQQNLPGARS